MENACTINGYICLPVLAINFDRQVSLGVFLFRVEFQYADGTPYLLGPCCGASIEEMPPQGVFFFRVASTGQGGYLVQDMPPLAP
jgi:NAD-dependent dihydropyrimidine dehydrogenase PreA subunit